MKRLLSLPWVRPPPQPTNQPNNHHNTPFPLCLGQWLWDFRALVSTLHAAWRATPWQEIKTEALVEQNKELLKRLRRQGNEQQVGWCAGLVGWWGVGVGG
jgi:hypothetical protein